MLQLIENILAKNGQKLAVLYSKYSNIVKKKLRT
jgi:hypothetical protein